MAKFNALEFWTRQVESQRKWVNEEHGGSLTSYIERYGDPDRLTVDGLPMYGDGGTAIYKADMAALKRAEDRLAEVQSRARR